ncbi:MAG TPA: DUF523 and DUF1722 domain-containing protein [Terriglobia bacterium]|nr:DUF523 and DUF1722 domain-containing protein [Terriglobia bacterium]
MKGLAVPRASREENPVPRVRVGISSCLLGACVRFDGGHKRDPFLTDSFGKYVEWIPVCPEVEMGLGVPRETLRLVERNGAARIVAPASGKDHTRAMSEWAGERLRQLDKEGLCGYVLKRGSPSCGLERVRVHHANGQVTKDGQGVYASHLVAEFPHLPIEEEGRLNDPRIRENFVSRVFSYQRWKTLCSEGAALSSLMTFHARHKYLLMSRNQAGASRLGALLGQWRSPEVGCVYAEYIQGFMDVMAHTPSRRGHTNVLRHLAGYFSERLGPDDRAELTESIERYRRELLPLIVPVTMVRHYVRQFQIAYLQDQIYLDPHPHELMLLNEL